MEKVNLSEKFNRFSDHWSPKVIAELNDYQFKLVRVSGSFIWHEHESTDEAFIVLEGSMTLDFEDQSIHLDAGEMLVVPKGVRHRPHAEEECLVMLVEPKDVINTGAERSDLQAANDVWI